jgi:hypothetical protein
MPELKIFNNEKKMINVSGLFAYWTQHRIVYRLQQNHHDYDYPLILWTHDFP